MAIVPTVDLVSAAEASVRLRITREQVIRRIQRGELAGVLREGRWLASLADVLRMEKARAVVTAGASR